MTQEVWTIGHFCNCMILQPLVPVLEFPCKLNHFLSHHSFLVLQCFCQEVFLYILIWHSPLLKAKMYCFSDSILFSTSNLLYWIFCTYWFLKLKLSFCSFSSNLLYFELSANNVSQNVKEDVIAVERKINLWWLF